MIFSPTRISGVMLIDTEPVADERGSFARTFCEREFAAHGLHTRFVQANRSWNRSRGTLRGMHFQREPAPEAKVVRCLRGAIFDVAVDLRRDSASFCQWVGVDLTAENRRALFVPSGCAHGFLTLTDDAEVDYLMGAFYDPALAGGVRWDDPAFAIAWPFPPAILSPRDAAYPDFRP